MALSVTGGLMYSTIHLACRQQCGHLCRPRWVLLVNLRCASEVMRSTTAYCQLLQSLYHHHHLQHQATRSFLMPKQNTICMLTEKLRKPDNHSTLETSLSLRFNGHFPGEPGLAGVYWRKGWWRWWWLLELVVQSSSQIIATYKPTSRHQINIIIICYHCLIPSVRWQCWLGDRKGFSL